MYDNLIYIILYNLYIHILSLLCWKEKKRILTEIDTKILNFNTSFCFFVLSFLYQFMKFRFEKSIQLEIKKSKKNV